MTIYRVWLSGLEYLVDITDTGAKLLSIGGESNQVNPNFKSFTFQIKGQKVIVQEVKRGESNPLSNRTSSGDIQSPMPGIVTKILVSEGDEVLPGQPLLILESMKMHMELRSPTSGTVLNIMVTPNLKVEKGILLVRIISP